jgi:hypothetical protein
MFELPVRRHPFASVHVCDRIRTGLLCTTLLTRGHEQSRHRHTYRIMESSKQTRTVNYQVRGALQQPHSVQRVWGSGERVGLKERQHLMKCPSLEKWWCEGKKRIVHDISSGSLRGADTVRRDRHLLALAGALHT